MREFRRTAAERAVDFVQSGMIVGLGTGDTVGFAVRELGARLATGALRAIVGVPTSRGTGLEATRLGIPLVRNDWPDEIDLTIDGADEVDPALDLIKGGGGALTREKIVAQASRRVIIVVDERKLSPELGTRSCVPVEVIPFGWPSHRRYLEALGAQVHLRLNAGGEPFRTDQDNFILDCEVRPLADPADLAAALCVRAGIVEHGLFLELATDVIVAGTGGIQHRRRS